jgi:hypothetical protein
VREIAAASDFDFVAAEPRRAPPKRGKAKKKAKTAWAWLSTLRRYVTPFFAVAALIGLLAAVAVNAMYLQHGRHPAPLFGATFKVEPPKPPPRPAHLDFLFGEKLPSRPPAPASATDASLTSSPLLPPAKEAQPAPAASAPAGVPASVAPAGKAAAAQKNQDAIGGLIGQRKAAAAKAKAAEKTKAAEKVKAEKARLAPAAAPANAMAQTQRALKKLGAPVKTDGHFDVATRNAVEAFQRRNHLPVNGELTPETRHLLAARSGLPVE